jgi:dCMP deaminase
MDRKISWHQYFMNMVDLVSTRSTCLRRKVGAIIVRDNRIITTGYNGPPSHIKECTPTTCIRTVKNIPSGERPDLCYAVHAEQNAIIQAAYIGVSVKDATMYTSGLPCFLCTKIILNSGISTIIVKEYGYDNMAPLLFSERADVCLHMLKNDVLYRLKINRKGEICEL